MDESILTKSLSKLSTHLERLVERGWNATSQVVIRGHVHHTHGICSQIIVNDEWQTTR